MAFSTPQIRKLRTKVRPQFIKERQFDGKLLPYVEAWHVIAEANRVFGHDGWDRETVSTQCIWQKPADGRFGAAYVARVRITVRADGITIIREGFGAGEAFSATPGQAHERAVKTAETDATKRALSTFGNCFGLALYQNKIPATAGATKPDHRDDTESPEPGAQERSQDEPAVMVEASPIVPNINAEDVTATSPSFGPTTANVEVSPEDSPGNDPASNSPESARTYITGAGQIVPRPASTPSIALRSVVDKSELLLGEPKRIRNPEHLRFVATKPCLVCGRQPSDAHHLRFTQPRALGKKVSDEFTVPLCRFHHDEVHRAGNEIRWWKARGIEPVAVALDLWTSSLRGETSDLEDDDPTQRDGTTAHNPP